MTDSYSIHPLVHKWARERPDISIAEQGIWSEAAAVLLSHCILIPPLGNTREDEDIRKHLLPHVDHVRECQASIEQRMRQAHGSDETMACIRERLQLRESTYVCEVQPRLRPERTLGRS